MTATVASMGLDDPGPPARVCPALLGCARPGRQQDAPGGKEKTTTTKKKKRAATERARRKAYIASSFLPSASSSDDDEKPTATVPAHRIASSSPPRPSSEVKPSVSASRRKRCNTVRARSRSSDSSVSYDAEEKAEAVVEAPPVVDRETMDAPLWSCTPLSNDSDASDPPLDRDDAGTDAREKRIDAFVKLGLQTLRYLVAFSLLSLQIYQLSVFVGMDEFPRVIPGGKMELLRLCRHECLVKERHENSIRYVKDSEFKINQGARCWVRLVYVFEDAALRDYIRSKRGAYADALLESNSPNRKPRFPIGKRDPRFVYGAPAPKDIAGLYNLLGNSEERATDEWSENNCIIKVGNSRTSVRDRAAAQMSVAATSMPARGESSLSFYGALDRDDSVRAEKLAHAKLRSLGFGHAPSSGKEQFVVCQHSYVLFHEVIVEVFKIFPVPDQPTQASGLVKAGPASLSAVGQETAQAAANKAKKRRRS